MSDGHRTSERVTWHVCPGCGALAAAGWISQSPAGEALPQDHPVEFDCTAGCGVGLEVARAHLSRGGPADPG